MKMCKLAVDSVFLSFVLQIKYCQQKIKKKPLILGWERGVWNLSVSSSSSELIAVPSNCEDVASSSLGLCSCPLQPSLQSSDAHGCEASSSVGLQLLKSLLSRVMKKLFL